MSDINPELINCYIEVRDNIQYLISELKTFNDNESFYYEIRSANLNELNSIERAARFIYLNRTCFNGLYRENKNGQFNVPYGKYKILNFVMRTDFMQHMKLYKGLNLYVQIIKQY